MQPESNLCSLLLPLRLIFFASSLNIFGTEVGKRGSKTGNLFSHQIAVASGLLKFTLTVIRRDVGCVNVQSTSTKTNMPKYWLMQYFLSYLPSVSHFCDIPRFSMYKTHFFHQFSYSQIH